MFCLFFLISALTHGQGHTISRNLFWVWNLEDGLAILEAEMMIVPRGKSKFAWLRTVTK